MFYQFLHLSWSGSVYDARISSFALRQFDDKKERGYKHRLDRKRVTTQCGLGHEHSSYQCYKIRINGYIKYNQSVVRCFLPYNVAKRLNDEGFDLVLEESQNDEPGNENENDCGDRNIRENRTTTKKEITRQLDG